VDYKLQKLVDKIQMTQQPCKHYTFNGDVPRRNGKLVVGNDAGLKTKILQHFHNSGIGGHSGYELTYRNIKEQFHWKGMKEVKQWVQQFLIRQQNKPLLHLPDGNLQPLPSPDRAWKSISIDFIVGLPKSKFMTVIFVIIDRLTKYAHFLPLSHCRRHTNLMDNVVKLHGWP